ncbi:MAG: hypothetical protein AB1749_11200 [Pseudomonadota bacterium]
MPWWLTPLTFAPLVIGALILGYIWVEAVSGRGDLGQPSDFLGHQRSMSAPSTRTRRART